MRGIRETIIVEGRYDVNTLKQCVDAHIIETSGFGIFNDKEKQSLIRMLAKKNGIIVLTDSDGAGFVIRNYLKGAIRDGVVKHAYIPEISGRERRKVSDSKAGLLGVEGMSKDVIFKALTLAGATFTDVGERKPCGNFTKQDMYEHGLSGKAESKALRERLAKELGLPGLMSANALLSAINMLYCEEELLSAIEKIK